MAKPSIRALISVVVSCSERVPADQEMPVLDSLTVTASVESSSVKERVPESERAAVRFPSVAEPVVVMASMTGWSLVPVMVTVTV